MRHRFSMIGLSLALMGAANLAGAQGDRVNVEITVLDGGSQKPVPCRIHLDNACGIAERSSDQLVWRDQMVCVSAGTARLELPPGRYTYDIERGLESRSLRGMLNTSAGDAGKKITLKLERLADLSAEGWWSGDLHVHRPLEDIEALMRAEDLHVANVITWWNRKNLWTGREAPANPLVRFDGDRYYHVMGGEDERGGGSLLYANLARPLAIAQAEGEHPGSLKFAIEARTSPGAWVDMEKPYGWDAPLWLASGAVDSAGLANANLCRDGMYRGGEEPGNCKPRDALRLPPPLGNGFWTLEVYFQMLNCGLRIPPSAGSASGGMPNPVGYNRAYVHVDGEFSYEKWWEGLRAGRSFVTNGPLLRVRAADQLPGHVFAAARGQEVDLEVAARISTRDPIRSLEIVRDGRVERVVAFDEWARTGSLGRVRFKESGWFLVRAVAENPRTFRFAVTAPYYVEIGKARHRISKASSQFFLDWLAERSRQIGNLKDPLQRHEVLEDHGRAKKFWEERVAQANAP